MQPAVGESDLLTADVAVTDQPPALNQIIRCPLCGNVLGVIHQGNHICRMTAHGKRREIVYREPVSITCEDCGAVWVPGQG